MMPEPVKPVAYRGRMTKDGYQPENHEWRDWLCDRDQNGGLVGKDPMTLPLDVLSASGHPQAKVRDVLARRAIMDGTDHGREGADGRFAPDGMSLTKIREHICVPCSSGNKAEVRRCAIYDCPAWAFRMGRNPHNPRRGVNPFEAA
jgi:hypothetical protein